MSEEAYRKANDIADSALKAVELAIALLESAEEVFDEEERKHSVPSASQHTAMRWQEANNELDRVYETLKGEPRIQVLGSTATMILRIGPGGGVTEEKII